MSRSDQTARIAFAATEVASDCLSGPRRVRRISPAIWRLAALTLMALCAGDNWLATSRSHAQQEAGEDVRAEYNVKAVFLYNFARYVQWPDEAAAANSGAFVIGIIGADPFQGALEEIAAKRTVRERPIVLRRMPSPEEYRTPCHIVFVPRSLTPEQQAILLEKVPGPGVLLVGETTGFAERGAVCNFVVEEGRIRFEINVEAAKRAQLRMDAKLLALGITIHERWPASSGQTAGSSVVPRPPK